MAGEAQRTPITGRIEFVDTARGIAMLCIVLGHLGIAPINYVVYTFHVPIFFLITGWFVSTKQGTGAFARKRARTLLVPYAATCLVLCLGKVVEALIKSGAHEAALAAVWWPVAALYASGSGTVPMPVQVASIGAIWFLWACFWGCVGLRLLLQLKQEWLRVLIVLVVALAGVFTAKAFFLPLSIQPGCVALGYMYVGWAARRYLLDWAKAWPRAAKVAALVGAGILWVAYIIWKDRVVFVEAAPGQHWWSIIGILAGCVSVLFLSWALTKAAPKLARPLMFLGKYSLIMLCVHILEMWFIDYNALVGLATGVGVPYLIAGGAAVVLKLAIIIGLTVLLAKWAPSRRLFGFAPLPAKAVR